MDKEVELTIKNRCKSSERRERDIHKIEYSIIYGESEMLEWEAYY